MKKGDQQPMTRRRWLGALAGIAAAVAGTVRRERPRPETAADKQRRRRFWIGHT